MEEASHPVVADEDQGDNEDMPPLDLTVKDQQVSGLKNALPPGTVQCCSFDATKKPSIYRTGQWLDSMQSCTTILLKIYD